ncbi:MAG TPA: PLD nuclease N-terminal domain-containing protein [Acidimicrobiales bacterium]|jgi:uncharacterized membrane protein
MLAASYPLWDVFVSTLYFALFIVWLIIIFHVVVDIMRSHDLSGAAKAAWVLFILILPLVGSLVYLVVRGGSMHERQTHAVQAQQKAFEDYIRKVANSKE